MKKTAFTCWMLGAFFCIAVIPSAQASLFTNDKTEAPQKAETVYELIRNHKNLERFADMINSADLQNLFKGADGPITVFAPTNEAIGDIPGPIMKRIRASKENLQSFVKYHVLVGSRVGTNAINGRKSSAAAANGESIVFDGTSTKDAPKINDGHMVEADLQVGNNIIHSISVALIPAALKAAPAEEKKEEPKPVATPIVVPPVVTTPAIGPDAKIESKLASEKNLTSSLSAPALPVGTMLPLGTATLLPATTSVPAAPPIDTDARKAKGFNFFGHHFGG